MNNFSKILVDYYRQLPSRVAITLIQPKVPDQSITYQQLIKESARFTRALSMQGISSGEVVTIILPQCEDLIYSFFGSVLLGAIPSIMPYLTEKLSPAAYRHSLEVLFKTSKPAAVITNNAFQDEVELARKSSSSVRVLLLVEETPESDDIQPDHFQGLTQSPDNIVLLQHSSGTTGLQKGVALSHRAVFNQLESYSQSILLNSSSSGEDVIISWLPLYHDMGLIAGFILPILKRTHLVLMSPFDWVRAPHKLIHAITLYKGTLTWMPNFAYNFCAKKIRNADLVGTDLTSLRAIINCSEPMYWQSHQMFYERFNPYGLRSEALATCYAMAENVFAVTMGGIETPVSVDRINRHRLVTQQIAHPTNNRNDQIKMLSAGKPIQNTQIKIIDNKGYLLTDRHVGEISLKSNCMLTNYYQRPDLTEEAFHEGWYLTGDLGYMVDGELFITGRKKDLIIVGGKNIYPQDLEQIASEVPGVHPGRVAAFGIFNEITGTEDVVIVAEVDDEVSPDGKIANEIRNQVTRSSDIALRNVKLVGRGWLLKTSSGKVARIANRNKYLNSE
jgi:fatty-acyl-CoA synthase